MCTASPAHTAIVRVGTALCCEPILRLGLSIECALCVVLNVFSAAELSVSPSTNGESVNSTTSDALQLPTDTLSIPVSAGPSLRVDCRAGDR